MRIRIFLLAGLAFVISGCGHQEGRLPPASAPGAAQSTPDAVDASIDNKAKDPATSAQEASAAPSADGREERPVPEAALVALRSFIARKVAEGFDGEARIIEVTVAQFVDGVSSNPFSFVPPEADLGQFTEQQLTPHIERITADLLDERRSDEAGWDEPTDCDKLDRAFDELNQQRIIARQNLPCCMTCARAEIWAVVDEEQKNGHAVIGYAFYHEQDTAHAPDGGLLLAFGSTASGEEQATEIGKKVIEALNRTGLKPQWSGDPNVRIAVTLDWKKRRFSSPPSRDVE
jgi:hypothetical protein